MSTRLNRHVACALLASALSVSGTPLVWQAPGDAWRINDDQLHAFLTSPDPGDWAWGSWLVGRDGRQDMTPLLEQIVRLSAALPGWEAGAALDAALDALIQLGATPSAELSMAVYPRRIDQLLILLSRVDAGAEEELLSILSREVGPRWFAAANILLARRTPGMPAVLRERLRAGDQEMFRGCIWGSNRSTFPPRAYYSLSLLPDSGLKKQSDGPVPVYYRRWVMPRKSSVIEGEGAIEQFRSNSARAYLTAFERANGPP
jgi:hypothetical protein